MLKGKEEAEDEGWMVGDVGQRASSLARSKKTDHQSQTDEMILYILSVPVSMNTYSYMIANFQSYM